MPRVTGPLFAQDARRQFGRSIVFQQGGRAKFLRDTPNWKAAAQGNARQRFKAAQAGIGRLISPARSYAKSIVPHPRKWNAWLLECVIGDNGEAWSNSRDAYNALSADARISWTAYASDEQLIDVALTYATDDPISSGLILFALARAMYAIDYATDNGAPGEANAEAWTLDLIGISMPTNALTLSGQALTLADEILTL